MVSSGPCRPSRPRPQRPCREGTAPSRETRVGGQPGAPVIYVLGPEGLTTGGCSGVTGGMNKGPTQGGFPAASKPARPRCVRSAGRTREVPCRTPRARRRDGAPDGPPWGSGSVQPGQRSAQALSLRGCRRPLGHPPQSP